MDCRSCMSCVKKYTSSLNKSGWTDKDRLQANNRRPPNAVLMLGQRLWRWPNINTALGRRPVFSGVALPDLFF